MSASRPVSATPPPSTLPKASPPIEGRIELLVQVRTVRSAGRDLEVLVGQPLLFDVVPEGDLAQTAVVPRTRENLLLLAVGGSQGLTTGRVRAGRALLAVRVAVDPGIPGSVRSASFRHPGHHNLFLAYSQP